MAYSWDNRVNFIIRNLYDIDNNGFLDKNDFACFALRATVMEGKGTYTQQRLQEYQTVMQSLWEELAQLADFDKDGCVTTEEFKKAVEKTCMGKKYEDFPQAMKMFIDYHFKTLDLNDDGVIGIDEFRYYCCTKFAVQDIEVVDRAYESLLNDDDRKRGGLNLARYQELYADFLGNPDEKNKGVSLFGPLEIINQS